LVANLRQSLLDGHVVEPVGNACEQRLDAPEGGQDLGVGAGGAFARRWHGGLSG
jgi:hypothetical protein